MNKSGKATEAKWGKKMIELTVKFWVNDIAEEKGKIMPRECWDSGMVRITANTYHGIKARYGIPFNSLMQLNSVIERLLIDNNIRLHHSRKPGKYYK